MFPRGVILVSVVLLLGLACFVFLDSLPFFQRQVQGDASAASVVQPAAAAPAHKPKLKPHRLLPVDDKGTAADATDRIASQTVLPHPALAYHLPVRAPSMPMSTDLPTGMSRAEVTAKFGRPDISATWKDSAHLSEKFIYTGSSQVTSILIQDGRVVSSGTEARYFPPVLTLEP